MVGGVNCGLGSAIYGDKGWGQKTMICLHGVSICADVASSMNEVDPLNQATITGDTIGKMSA